MFLEREIGNITQNVANYTKTSRYWADRDVFSVNDYEYFPDIEKLERFYRSRCSYGNRDEDIYQNTCLGEQDTPLGSVSKQDAHTTCPKFLNSVTLQTGI